MERGYLANGKIGIVVGQFKGSSWKPQGLPGLTPNFHAQTDIVPFVVNGPITPGNCLVMPGAIVVADDDAAVVVPVKPAEQVIEIGAEHHDWEEFSKQRLERGGDLRRYYPLTEAARPEYEAWLKAQGRG